MLFDQSADDGGGLLAAFKRNHFVELAVAVQHRDVQLGSIL
jgi:hypothetical protein